MTSAGFNVPYLYMYRNSWTIFTLLYLPPPASTLPFVLHSCSFLFKCLSVHCSEEFCLGILPGNLLCLNWSNPLYYTFLSFPLILYCSTVFSMFCSYTDVTHFNIIHSLQVFSSFLPPLASFSLLQQSHVCVIYGSNFHMWEKTCNLCLSDPGLLHLAWCSPFPPIHLQMTEFHSSLWMNSIRWYICVTSSFLYQLINLCLSMR
jgi:hypothetical protein